MGDLDRDQRPVSLPCSPHPIVESSEATHNSRRTHRDVVPGPFRRIERANLGPVCLGTHRIASAKNVHVDA
jgi:hypothetical protein